MESKGDTVQLVLLNDKGEVLAVSRKNNHFDFGLIGGKVDPEDKSLIDAMIRETKEETGLTIKEEDLELIFVMHKYGWMGYTYFTNKWEGEIEYDEPHVVKWTTFDEIFAGTFGEWNLLTAESLLDMGVNIKLHDGRCETCGGTGEIGDVYLSDLVKCFGAKHLDEQNYIEFSRQMIKNKKKYNKV